MRVRLDNIDHTLARPGALDESTLPKVPVIRIYGLTSTGQRACLNVHQVYPYFFVDYLGSLNPDRVKRYILKLINSLNHAIALSLHRNPHGPNAQYIRAIILVKGIPFYGFHTVYRPFLKILIADPTWVSRTVTILQSGGVMRTKFTTYESHLSYYLQFMSDFGLYGCGWVDLGEVFLRGVDEEGQEVSDIPGSPHLHQSPYFKQSRTPLELDVCSHQIQNRHVVEPRDIHSSLKIPACPLPPDPLVHSVRELWEDERRRRISKGLPATPDMPKLLSEHRRSKGGEWVDFERLQALLTDKCNQEKAEGKVYKERSKSWERWVMSTFESVEALWEVERRTWRPKGVEGEETDKFTQLLSGTWNMMTLDGDQHGAVPEIEVDETMLSSQEMNKLVDDEEQQGGIRDREDEEECEGDMDGVDLDAEDGPPPELQNENVPEPVQNESYMEQTDKNPAINRAHNPISSEHVTPHDQEQHIINPGQESSKSLILQERNVRQQGESCSLECLTHSTPPSSATSPLLARSDAIVTQISSPAINEIARLVPTDLDQMASSTPTHIEAKDKRGEMGSFLTTSSSSASKSFGSNGEPVATRQKLGIQRTSSTSSTDLNQPQVITFQAGTGHTVTNSSSHSFVYEPSPPRTATLFGSIPAHGILYKEYRDPYYSVSDDLPVRPREYAGLLFDLTHGSGTTFLPPWVAGQESKTEKLEPLEAGGVSGWEYAGWPPSRKKVIGWLEEGEKAEHGVGKVKQDEGKVKGRPQIDGQTQGNVYGFKATPQVQADATRERQNMSILALEVFAKISVGKVPDPSEDEIVAVFYSFQDGSPTNPPDTEYKTGIVAIESEHFNTRIANGAGDIAIVSSELDLINGIIDVVLELDPDIVAGWEVQAASWGYLEARGRTFGLDVSDTISRAPVRQLGGGSDQWGMRNTSTFKIVGRHVLNVWRIMRVELSLNIYSFENVAFQLLHRRVPKYSVATLNEWFNSLVQGQTARVLRYLLSRTCMILEMLDAADVVTKTAEFARVFGVDFFSVISRGSQFKVESFMFRIAKPESLVLISPNKADVGKQNAAECMPLIMEPYSAFYKGPLVVLDFQSLYPSVMIAYNYCYSTCLGRVQNFKGKNKFGVTHLENPPGLLTTLQDYLFISPNGMVFVKPEVRKGLLGRMLTELLDTRVMVKQAMKSARGDKALMRVLDARQLSLKFIANVTYGYTSATFSGRMPAVEIADAIVQSGRETLEKAIELVESTEKWGARVVYGDTDSLFIYLQGRTKEQAFLIGNEMADAVTAQNPAPIKLKFEKVYLPCVLMAKKRYVGFKYERPDDQEPAFDAKGIETVRRDGIAAQQKMVERCLKILFRSQDLSAVKEYCQTSWQKILEGSVSMQDFIFSKEVRLGTYSDKVPPPPGAAVAARRLLQDANDEPQYGERVPYVIARGEPGTKLVDRAVAPEELLGNSHKHIDAEYYISRVLIPPLERIFNLMGADVRSWYDAMMKSAVTDNPEAILASPERPKADKKKHPKANLDEGDEERVAIDAHYRSNQCVLCGTSTDEVVCWLCRHNPQESLHALQGRLQEAEHRLTAAHAVCVSCTLSPPAERIKCESLDCPWLYARDKAEEDVEILQGVPEITEAIERLAAEEDMEEGQGERRSDAGSDEVISSASDSDVFL